MKKKFFCFLLFIFKISCFSQQPYIPQIELVESIPMETNLDNPDIRNAPDVWLEMIKYTKSTLDIEEFYISNKKGEILQDVIKAIFDASKRGVKIRLIVDSKMYKTYPETVDMFRIQQNILVRVIDFGKLAGGIQHAKYFIVDGEEIFLGSQNFDWRALTQIHELGIRIKQRDIVKVYQDIFDLDWKLAEKNDPSEINKLLNYQTYPIPFTLKADGKDNTTIIPTMSPRGLIIDSTLWDEKYIVALIDKAKNEVNCQFLTYSPVERIKGYYSVLDNALRRAAARGVKVKMIVSDWSINHPTIEYLQSLACLPNIEIKYTAIPDWSGGNIPYARVEHCKFLSIDSSSCWIGTSNWEKSYFYNCRNLGVVIENHPIAKQVRSIFYKSWNGVYAIIIKPEIEYTPRKHGE